MGHAFVRRDGDIVAGPHLFTWRQADGILLDDFLDEGLWFWGGRGFKRGENGGSGRVLPLGVEYVWMESPC